jgi:hypothetical protein
LDGKTVHGFGASFGRENGKSCRTVFPRKQSCLISFSRGGEDRAASRTGPILSLRCAAADLPNESSPMEHLFRKIIAAM